MAFETILSSYPAADADLASAYLRTELGLRTEISVTASDLETAYSISYLGLALGIEAACKDTTSLFYDPRT